MPLSEHTPDLPDGIDAPSRRGPGPITAAQHVALGLSLLEIAGGSRMDAARLWLDYQTLAPGTAEELTAHRQLAQARQAWAAASAEATAHLLAAQVLVSTTVAVHTVSSELDAQLAAIKEDLRRRAANDDPGGEPS